MWHYINLKSKAIACCFEIPRVTARIVVLESLSAIRSALPNSAPKCLIARIACVHLERPAQAVIWTEEVSSRYRSSEEAAQ